MSNDTRQRLWWKAQRISFAWWAWRNEGDKPPLMTRQEWARLVYRIFSQYPEEALKNE